MNTLRLIRMFGSVNDIKTSRYQKDVGNWNIQSKKEKKDVALCDPCSTMTVLN